MKRTVWTPRTRLLVGCLFVTICFLFAACQAGDAEWLRAERPVATSTPAPPVQTPVAKGGKQAAIPNSFVAPASADQLRRLPTEEQLRLVTVPTRDLRDLAERLKPGVAEIPLVVNAERPNYEVGDRITFWVHNVQNNSNTEITAELFYKTDVAYAWVEADQPFDREALIASIDRFSTTSYPAEVAFFGSEANPGVDNDPRMHILHTTKTGSGVAGYYSSADEYSQLANPFSNQKEMFYINLNWLNASRDYESYETVLAHEFQHMVHWANDRNEETWVNEGLSEFAQEVAGYGPETVFARTFANHPDTQLNAWRESTSNNAEHYGSAYLFMTYFAQRFGPDVTKLLVAHPANGIAGISAALAEAGLDEDFDSVFADWVVANYADDPNALGLDGVYGYRDFEQMAPRLDGSYDTYPTARHTSTVYNQATDYIALTGRGDVTVDFQGQAHTRLADTAPYSGEFAWWSNRGDDSDTRLTRRFDLSTVSPGEPVEMDVAMWWDIETSYDYGYVLVSRDGEQWDILAGQRTTLENPSGNGFGAAYTGRSGEADAANEEEAAAQWVTERFDLSPYVGDPIFVRFEYVTDDAVTKSGWLIDDIRIPALDYATDFEDGLDGWESEGWLLTTNQLEQRWLVQVLEMQDNILTNVHRAAVDADGNATIDINGLGDGRSAVLAISALAPVTTEAAEYTFDFAER